MTIDEMKEVLTAHQCGKTIQFKAKLPAEDWVDCLEPHWDFHSYDFSIKPEPPKPREWWLHINPETVHVREVIE